MKFIVMLLSILVFPALGADEVLQRLISITDKQTFLQYKENIHWIEKSPNVTYIPKIIEDVGRRHVIETPGA